MTKSDGRYLKDHLSEQPGGWAYKRGVPTSLRTLVGRKLWSTWLGSSKKITRDAALAKARALATQHDDLLAQLAALPKDEQQQVIAAGGFYSWRSGRIDVYADHYVATVTAELRPDPDDDEATQAQVVLAAYRAKENASELARSVRAVTTTTRKLNGTADRPQMFDLVELWENTARRGRKRRPPGAHRRKRVRGYVKTFAELVGDLEPKAVRRDHILSFRDKLQAKGFTPDNIDQYLAALNTLLRVGASEGVVPFNSADGINARPGSNGTILADEAEDFVADELRRIFTSLDGESADFQWTIRLLTYHGMRSGEACFLRCSDVRAVHGIPILDVHDKKGGRVKNDQSVRQIPVHPKCKGIIAYANKVRAAHPDEADPWLFMSYYPTKTTTREHSFQNYANGKFLRTKVGIVDRRSGNRQYDKSIHSLRHGFETACREAEAPLAIQYALTGRKLGPGEGGKYGTVPSLKLRAKWIAKIDPLRG